MLFCQCIIINTHFIKIFLPNNRILFLNCLSVLNCIFSIFSPSFFTVHLVTVKNAPLRFWETICIYFITFEHVFRNEVCAASLLLPRDLCGCTRKKLWLDYTECVLKSTLLILYYFNALTIRPFRSAIHCVSADNIKQETSLIGGSKIKNLIIMTCNLWPFNKHICTAK